MNLREIDSVIEKHKQHNEQITVGITVTTEIAEALEEQHESDMVQACEEFVRTYVGTSSTTPLPFPFFSRFLLSPTCVGYVSSVPSPFQNSQVALRARGKDFYTHYCFVGGEGQDSSQKY
eukprot:TRINITY_DN2578_c0_g1_i19.p2 TRINITY_DN2578_c0_g1~~TRINITY_DN2578_c0_g1_i19.p2  ORF type:complete len:120 (-),score=24.25 TRINITY_DN2578_c0_g1_i19:1146-1505(-)